MSMMKMNCCFQKKRKIDEIQEKEKENLFHFEEPKIVTNDSNINEEIRKQQEKEREISTKDNPPSSLLLIKESDKVETMPLKKLKVEAKLNSTKENSSSSVSSPLNSNDQIVNTTENPPSSLIKKKRKRQRHFGNK